MNKSILRVMQIHKRIETLFVQNSDEQNICALMKSSEKFSNQCCPKWILIIECLSKNMAYS